MRWYLLKPLKSWEGARYFLTAKGAIRVANKLPCLGRHTWCSRNDYGEPMRSEFLGDVLDELLTRGRVYHETHEIVTVTERVKRG